MYSGDVRSLHKQNQFSDITKAYPVARAHESYCDMCEFVECPIGSINIHLFTEDEIVDGSSILETLGVVGLICMEENEPAE